MAELDFDICTRNNSNFESFKEVLMRVIKFCVTIMAGGLADVADNAFLREASQAITISESTLDPKN
jgi:hypothetical protein